MRPALGAGPDTSSTPIYDSLCAEYRRVFRTLPGDRSGEEDFGFQGFGPGPIGTYGSHHGGYAQGPAQGGMGYAPVPHTAYPGAGWQPYPAPRPHVGHHPALPPAPRRGI